MSARSLINVAAFVLGLAIGTTAHLRPSEWTWIDAVGGAAFLAAKLDAAGGEHHG